jgi:hypothetical protein
VSVNCINEQLLTSSLRAETGGGDSLILTIDFTVGVTKGVECRLT